MFRTVIICKYFCIQTSFRQSLTIYNVYHHELEFKILVTRPYAYQVDPPDGMVPPKSSIHIAIRFLQESTDDFPEDKFMVNVSHPQLRAMKGKQVIPVLGSTLSFSNSKLPVTIASTTPVPTKPVSSISLVAKLLPMTLGVAAMCFFGASRSEECADGFWLSFFLGMIVMYFQQKFLAL
jgi:hypothetical protein